MIRGWFHRSDARTYADEVAALDIGARLVEVGCWEGKSLACIAPIAKALELDVYAVDTWEGSSSPTCPTHGRDVFDKFMTNMRAIDLWSRLTVLRMDSLIAARGLEDETVDLVFIDADHEYPFVLADCRAWWPKVKPGGVMMGHDWTSWPNSVQPAVNRFAEQNGLAVYAKDNIWMFRKESQ